MTPLISYDDSHMLISAKDRKSVQKRLIAAHKQLESLRVSEEQGFFGLPDDSGTVRIVERLAKKVQAKFDRLIVIGIGGSDLGARTIWHALGEKKMSLEFVSNPDPETLYHVLATTDWSKTAINVISKSGTTLETMAVFMTLRQGLINAVGVAAHREHIVATTDPSEASTLYQIAMEEGYAILPHPLNVGGRYSVLSVVGLFPAAASGVNVRKLLAGAATVEAERRAKRVESIPARLATNQYLAMTQYGRDIHVLMPYADLLHEFGFWYRQIWAESLGKVRDGESVGPTPIAAFGAIDQHSQIQLYNEGPDNKTVTFIEVESFRRSLRVPKVWGDKQGIGYVGGLSFADILHAERAGTEHALASHGRPSGTITIPNISEESLGALFMLFETATAYMGELLHVNAFNQPGVEAGKKEAKKILETAGKKTGKTKG